MGGLSMTRDAGRPELTVDQLLAIRSIGGAVNASYKSSWLAYSTSTMYRSRGITIRGGGSTTTSVK